jgi:hypothetical protein
MLGPIDLCDAAGALAKLALPLALLAPIPAPQPHFHGIPANLADERLGFLPEQFLYSFPLP